MKRKFFLVVLVPVLAVNCFSQKSAIAVTPAADATDNKMAMTFSKSLTDEVEGSSKFYNWTGDLKSLPVGAVQIRIHATPIQFSGDSVGAAIFVEAVTLFSKDRSYSRAFTEQMFVFRADASVTDSARSFLADIDRLRPH